MKIVTLLKVIAEIEGGSFDFHGVIGNLISFHSEKDYYFQIMIKHQFDEFENQTFALISFDLRVGSMDFQLDSKAICFNSIDSYIEYAKKEFVKQISEYHIKEFL